MKQTAIIMGMPVTIEIVDGERPHHAIAKVFQYLRTVDERYSPYLPNSEVSQLNAGKPLDESSQEMQHIMALCQATKQETGGFFDVEHNGKIDPSGLVKGWAIQQVALQLRVHGFSNFSVEAGGDFQVHGRSSSATAWRIGIRNPRNRQEIIRVLSVSDNGVATSGTAIRGQHIYNPVNPGMALTDVLSITVVGPTIYDADRYATAAFAMGREGVHFIESLDGFEAYMVDASGVATLTSGFERYCV